MNTNETWYVECLFGRLETASKELDIELTCCMLTPDQYRDLEEIVVRLTKIAVTRKPRETADVV
jgi:hypothetical protein